MKVVSAEIRIKKCSSIIVLCVIFFLIEYVIQGEDQVWGIGEEW